MDPMGIWFFMKLPSFLSKGLNHHPKLELVRIMDFAVMLSSLDDHFPYPNMTRTQDRNVW